MNKWETLIRHALMIERHDRISCLSEITVRDGFSAIFWPEVTRYGQITLAGVVIMGGEVAAGWENDKDAKISLIDTALVDSRFPSFPVRETNNARWLDCFLYNYGLNELSVSRLRSRFQSIAVTPSATIRNPYPTFYGFLEVDDVELLVGIYNSASRISYEIQPNSNYAPNWMSDFLQIESELENERIEKQKAAKQLHSRRRVSAFGAHKRYAFAAAVSAASALLSATQQQQTEERQHVSIN
jgi:hypothetical protein